MPAHLEEFEVEEGLAAEGEDLELRVDVGGGVGGGGLVPELGGDVADEVERVLVHGEGRLLRHPVVLHRVPREDEEEDGFQVLDGLQCPVRLLLSPKQNKKNVLKQLETLAGKTKSHLLVRRVLQGFRLAQELIVIPIQILVRLLARRLLKVAVVDQAAGRDRLMLLLQQATPAGRPGKG